MPREERRIHVTQACTRCRSPSPIFPIFRYPNFFARRSTATYVKRHRVILVGFAPDQLCVLEASLFQGVQVLSLMENRSLVSGSSFTMLVDLDMTLLIFLVIILLIRDTLP